MKSLNIAKSFRSFSSDGFKPSDVFIKSNSKSKLDLSALSARTNRSTLKNKQSIKNLLITSNVLKIKLKNPKNPRKVSQLTNYSDCLSDISMNLSQYNMNQENLIEQKLET